MRIVVFAHSDSRACERLSQAIESVELDRPLEIHEEMGLFCRRFRLTDMHPDIVIIMPANHEELDTLIRFRELFENSRTIVILPERQHAILDKGHKFHPSYIAYNDDDFMEVAAILSHLKRNPCAGDESLMH